MPASNFFQATLQCLQLEYLSQAFITIFESLKSDVKEFRGPLVNILGTAKDFHDFFLAKINPM